MFDRQNLRAGSQVLIAAPKTPMEPRKSAILRNAVEREPDIAFACTPLVFMPGRMTEPRQILYVVLNESARGTVERVVASLAAAIHPKWEGDYIDMLPVFEHHSLLSTVLSTGSLLVVNDESCHRRCSEAAAASQHRANHYSAEKRTGTT